MHEQEFQLGDRALALGTGRQISIQTTQEELPAIEPSSQRLFCIGSKILANRGQDIFGGCQDVLFAGDVVEQVVALHLVEMCERNQQLPSVARHDQFPHGSHGGCLHRLRRVVDKDDRIGRFDSTHEGRRESSRGARRVTQPFPVQQDQRRLDSVVPRGGERSSHPKPVHQRGQ